MSKFERIRTQMSILYKDKEWYLDIIHNLDPEIKRVGVMLIMDNLQVCHIYDDPREISGAWAKSIIDGWLSSLEKSSLDLRDKSQKS